MDRFRWGSCRYWPRTSDKHSVEYRARHARRRHVYSRGNQNERTLISGNSPVTCSLSTIRRMKAAGWSAAVVTWCARARRFVRLFAPPERPLASSRRESDSSPRKRRVRWNGEQGRSPLQRSISGLPFAVGRRSSRDKHGFGTRNMIKDRTWNILKTLRIQDKEHIMIHGKEHVMRHQRDRRSDTEHQPEHAWNMLKHIKEHDTIENRLTNDCM